MSDLQGPGRFSLTYVATGSWGPGRYTKRLVLGEGEGWEEAKEKLWRQYHMDPLRPYRPTFELHRWKRMAS